MTLRIIPYNDAYAQDFTDINLEWLNSYFKPEGPDVEVLSNPQKYIIDKGGEIYFAQMDDGRIVGAISLKHQGNGLYELSKMGVRPTAQGMGAGGLMIQHVIDRYLEIGGKKLYLESNDMLRPAIYLYEKHGFHHANFPFSSSFERANVYMEWQGHDPAPVNIQPADTKDEIARVKEFFTDYALWLQSETGLSLDFQGFPKEMETFPDTYKCLLLAYRNRQPIGAVALKDHGDGVCEMKRLYVRPDVHRSGAGRALSICIMNRAKNYGFTTMLLDSLRRLEPAVKLYSSLGFAECDPYNENPEDDVIYMQRTL